MGARAARDPRAGLPEVLRSPMLADRLAAELEVSAAQVEGDGPADRERRAFLASAALQVAQMGTNPDGRYAPGQGYREPSYTPDVLAADLETRAG